jgi:hypothetical protein
MSNWWDTKLQGNAGKGLQPGLLRKISNLHELHSPLTLREPRQTTFFDDSPDFWDPKFADPRPSETGSVSYRLSYTMSAPRPAILLKKESPASTLPVISPNF